MDYNENQLSQIRMNIENHVYSKKLTLNHFKADLFQAFHVEENPKRYKAFEVAYEYGHSSGLNEIVNYFIDIVRLIK